MKTIVQIGIVILVVSVIYGFWLVGKKINYALAYEDGVETTVKEMVKPECLKEIK